MLNAVLNVIFFQYGGSTFLLVGYQIVAITYRKVEQVTSFDLEKTRIAFGSHRCNATCLRQVIGPITQCLFPRSCNRVPPATNTVLYKSDTAPNPM